jgi:hypothetical protein
MTVCHPFPIPMIGDIIRSMEGFTIASALDLNMGYYYIKLYAGDQNLCTIVCPWNMGKIQIQTITHGYQDFLVPDFSKIS